MLREAAPLRGGWRVRGVVRPVPVAHIVARLACHSMYVGVRVAPTARVANVCSLVTSRCVA